MVIRGWIYVLSNKAMPGLLKIGFSTKDPSLRVDELNSTGLPYPFVVEYDTLVVGPREVEQAVHAKLKPHHEAKEFFRVSVRAAVSAIESVLNEQDKLVIAEQRNFDESLAVDRGQALSKDTCPICGFLNSSNNSRCSRCFALLP